MSNTILLLCLFAGSISIVTAGPSGLVSFPYAENPCTCDFLTCTCCTGIQVGQVGFKKTVCALVTVNIFQLEVDVTIQLNGKTLSQFTFSATNPPTYCIPILLPINIQMCLKVHDVKLISLSGIQICMTVYAGYGKNLFTIPFNCVRVSAGSLQYFTTSSTTSTTTKRPAVVAATTTTAAPSKQAVVAVATTTAAPSKLAVVADTKPAVAATKAVVAATTTTAAPSKLAVVADTRPAAAATKPAAAATKAAAAATRPAEAATTAAPARTRALELLNKVN